VLRTFGGAAGAPAGGRGGAGGGRGGAGGIPNTTALWREPPEPVATGPGMHRAMWVPVAGGGGRGRGRGGGATLTGTFTARLNAGGKSYTQTFSVLPETR
jgi:translation initiation factor IF-2